MPLDGQAIAEQLLEGLHTWFADLRKTVVLEFGNLRKELDDKLAAFPIPKDGTDGKSITPEEVIPSLELYVEKRFAANYDDWAQRCVELADGFTQKLKELEPQQGPKGDPGTSITLDEVLPPVQEKVEALFGEFSERAAESIDQRIKEIPPAKDGEKGEKGDAGVTADEILPKVEAWTIREVALWKERADVELEQTTAVFRATVDSFVRGADEYLKTIPKPKDGANGKDGASVSVDDLRGVLEAATDRWALEFERRAQDVLQRAVDRIPAPPSGKDGKDGLGFDDLEIVHDGERRVTFRMQRGEQVKETTIVFPSPIVRGPYIPGATYEKGDGVTYGGSLFFAQKDTKEKPEASPDWKLTVKRGRDGKDGEKGDKGEDRIVKAPTVKWQGR